jgi:hypothetical protein
MSNLNFDPSNQSQKIKGGVGVVVIVSRKVKSKKRRDRHSQGGWTHFQVQVQVFSIPSVYIYIRSSAPVDYYYYYYYYLEKGEMIFISLEFSNRCSSTTLPLSTRGLSLHPPFYLSTERGLTKHTHTQQWGSLSHLLGRSWRCYFSWTPALNFSSVYFTFRCYHSPTIFSWKGKWPNDRRSTPSDLLFFFIFQPLDLLWKHFSFPAPTGVVC